MAKKLPMKFNTENFGFGKVVNREPNSLEAAYSRWQKETTPDTTNALLHAAAPVISKALTSYAGGDKALTGRAKVLALDAFKKYDLNKGTKLQTHLLIQLQPLRREYMKRTASVHVPERVHTDKLHLDNAEREFRELHNRDPSDTELSEITGLSAKRMAKLRAFTKGIVTESQTVTEDGGIQLPGSEAISADDIWLEYVHYDLDPIDQKIFEWKTGIYGKQILSTNEIARRLGITPGAVSQRAAKIAMKIEEGKNVGG